MAEETQLPELKRLMEVVIQKVDGMASDVRSNSYKLDGVESRLGRVEERLDRVDTRLESLEIDVREVRLGLKDLRNDVQTLTGQFNDVGSMAIKNHTRVDSLEQRVDILEQKPH